MRKFWHKIFGEPVYTVDFDGQIRKSRLKRSGNFLRIKGIASWHQAYEDGNINKSSYISKWYPR